MLACVWLAERAQAQPSIGTATDFNTTEYFDPPHENQVKLRITGVEAQQQSGGRYLIRKLKLETFRETGQREIVIEAPECLYDSPKRVASSPGPLQVQSGDGRVSVAGEGFLWEQSRGSLTISNQIRSVIQRAPTNAPALAPLVITSHWFTFEATNRSAIFHDEVRGDDPEMEFTCGQLAVHAAPDGGSFEVIEAGQSPVIIGKSEGRRATADRMVYTRADERAELIGNATWQQGRQSGRADRTVVYRLEKDFAADGHVAMKLPRESLGAGGRLLSGSNAPVATADVNAPLVDLFADHFHSRSNLLVAEGAVRLVDVTNRLSCDKLTMQSATTNAPEETATAEGNVVVERGGGSLRAARAVYTKSDAAIVFTGEPHWTQTQMEGRAERVTIHSATGEIHAENQVAVKVQLGAQGSSVLTFFPASGNTHRGPQVIEIFAHEFMAKERLATFLGEAHAHESPITGGEPRLRSDTLELQLAADGQRAERITASNHVVFEQGTIGVTNGPAKYRKLTAQTVTARPSLQTNGMADLVADGDVQLIEPDATARGEHATYTGAMGIVELTGNPMVDTPKAIVTGRTLVWDKANNRFAGSGYKIKSKPEPVGKTAEALKAP